MDIQILKSDELVEPVNGEFDEDLAAASGEHEAGS